MTNFFKSYCLLFTISTVSLASPLLALTISLVSTGLFYKYFTITKPILLGSRLNTKTLQIETWLRLNSVGYYHLAHLTPIEYISVIFCGYLQNLFDQPVLINYDLKYPKLVELQGFIDGLVETMMNDFVLLLGDLDGDAMAVAFVNENASRLPYSFQTQMELAYKYHTGGIGKNYVGKLLKGKSRKEVLKELFVILDTFFADKSLLFDNWTLGTASIFGRMILMIKYSKSKKSRADFNRNYPHLSRWIEKVESSLHGDAFPFRYTKSKIAFEIHLKSIKPLLRFAHAYFVPFLLYNGEKYKHLIENYDKYIDLL
jgi:hypothetical protein